MMSDAPIGTTLFPLGSHRNKGGKQDHFFLAVLKVRKGEGLCALDNELLCGGDNICRSTTSTNIAPAMAARREKQASFMTDALLSAMIVQCSRQCYAPHTIALTIIRSMLLSQKPLSTPVVIDCESFGKS